MLVFRFLRRLIKALIYLVIIVILIPVAGLIYGFLTTDDRSRGRSKVRRL